MSGRNRGVGIALWCAAMNACALAIAQQPDSTVFPADQIKRGSVLYATNCESCHGVRMIGPPWGSDLTTFPRDNRTRFIDSVTHGRNTMPPWGDVLKPDDIAALWAYVVAGEPQK